MHRTLIEQCTPDVVERAARLWGYDATDLRLISQVENFIYECGTAPASFILRITHEQHRSAQLVHAELEWMAYLASRGVSVAPPIRSSSGTLVETVFTDAAAFHVSAFALVPGREIAPADPAWNAELFARWGALVGRMHRVTNGFVPQSGARRPQWHTDDTIVVAPSLLPDGDPARRELDRLMAWMHTLPKPAQQFGLIHADVHSGNFLVDGDALHLFDFDDCCYHWFMYDIAVVIWHSIPRRAGRDERTQRANALLRPFLAGYAAEYPLDPAWVALIPEFLRLRDVLLLFTVLKWHRGAFNERHLQFCDAIAADIRDGVPAADLDLSL